MLEKNFQRDVAKYIKQNFREPAAFEYKVTDTSLPFAAVKDHQIDALLNAKRGKLYWKIPDVGYQNPFDAIFITKVAAFVVVRYRSGGVYFIDIDRFVSLRESGKRKSLTEEEARLNSIISF